MNIFKILFFTVAVNGWWDDLWENISGAVETVVEKVSSGFSEPGSWDQWTEWTAECSATCGGGSQVRTRTCKNGNIGEEGCTGEVSENKPCQTQLCPSWDEWTEWTAECSVTCGGGTQVRTRTCKNGNVGEEGCTGKASENKPCQTQLCRSWDEWTEWAAECSVTCGGGTQVRTRTCRNGNVGEEGCTGQVSENKPCQTQLCLTKKYIVGEYCWTSDMCTGKDNLNEVKNGEGRCSACDGPEGQKGFCCRGDNIDTGCDSTFQSELVKAGRKYGHYCIYSEEDAYPSQSDGKEYIAGQVKWCILSNLSAEVCADRLVNNLEHHFGGYWGCMVTKPENGIGTRYYYHYDDVNKYYVRCYPYSSTSVERSELIYLCRNAEHACAGESSVQTCMRDLLTKTPTFCPDKYTLLVAPSDQNTAFDHRTTNYGHTAKGGDYECSVACHSYPTGWDD